jgi:alanyl-tRNA synthetase
MTLRLYYTDSMLTSFDATVQEAAASEAGTRVVLDQTAFYPTSGGQPFDTGRLGGWPVVDVFDRDDGEVEHLVAGHVEPGQQVAGEIDWGRRFDHMQQHTGQHVLSAAFERRARARTVSFHLGTDGATIDLAREVSPEDILEAEALANAVVWENRAVAVRFASAEEAAALPLRKEPSRSGELRLVEVPGFDLSACGGTHVTETGRIGIIAVTGWERFKGGSRIAFVCGERALRSHRRLRDVTLAASRVLSVGGDELAEATERLQTEQRDRARQFKRLEEELARFRAVVWRDEAETIGALRGVLRIDTEMAPATLKALALAVVEAPGLVAVLVGGGSPTPVVMARSSDVTVDAAAWIRAATGTMGGRGGGRPELAQGGILAEPDRVMTFTRDWLAGAS